MKALKIIGWCLILLSLVMLSYAIYQQVVMGQNIKALHIIAILGALIGGVNALWQNKRTQDHRRRKNHL
jgi:hypothetical protein